MEVEEHVVDLVDEDDGYDGDEVSRVDRILATLHEECGNEETEGDNVHADAENLVEKAQLAIVDLLVLLFRQHRVNHQAESEEQGVLGEQEDEEEAGNVSACELVDNEVADDDKLHDKKGFGL